jgi:hypothetical protein
MALVIGILEIYPAHSVAENTGAIQEVLAAKVQGTANSPSDKYLIRPDQYDPKGCEKYFENLKPGLISSAADAADKAVYTYPEQETIRALCDARTADLTYDDPEANNDENRTLPAAFVKAIIESNEFDTPGYDSISISGAIIDGDLILSKIKINNALHLNDITFLGGVDLSYSSTEHNLDISGLLPDSAMLCLRGFQSTRSMFITHLRLFRQVGPTQIHCDEKVINSIDLPGARIGGELNIDDVNLGSVNAVGAQIAGQVQIQESRFSGIDQSPDLNFQGASAGEFIIRGVNVSTVDEQTTAERCLEHRVDLDGINILGYAQFVRSDFCGISLTGAHVGRNLDLLGLTLGFFDFTGSNADGDLQIAPSLPYRPTKQAARLPKWLGHATSDRGMALHKVHFAEQRHARGAPGRPTRLLASDAAPSPSPVYQPNLVLSHSSIALLRVAFENWPFLSRAPGLPPGMNCEPRSDCMVTNCETSAIAPPSLPGENPGPLAMFSEWTLGYPGTIKENYPTIVADFRFKSFGKPTFCAFYNSNDTDEDKNLANSEKKPKRRRDHISDDLTRIKVGDVRLWLVSTQYSPAEYQLIYDLLTANGQSSDARTIGYLGKLIETRLEYNNAVEDGDFSSLPAFVLNLLARLSIGYGYCSYVAMIWVAFLSLVGAVFFATANAELLRTNDGLVYDEHGPRWRKLLIGNMRVKRYREDLKGTPKHEQDYGLINPFGYSFDTLLPLIRLRELHYQIEVGGWRHLYFYFHRVFGWVLGVFLLAAFSGLIR